MASTNANNALDVLQQMFNEVLVQTGKALKSSSKHPKGDLAQLQSVVNTKIPASITTFHDALDDLESEIVRAKSVLLRDLNQLRAKRALVVEPKPMPSAPPAPMDAEQDFTMLDAAPTATMVPTAPLTGTGPPMKTENKPVAPFPNMGSDLPMSPEVPPAPAPAAAAGNPNQTTLSPAQAAAQAAATGRPASAPPKKEPKAAHPPPPHSAAAASPRSPASAAMAPSLTAPLSLPTTATPAPASVPAASGPEMVFTDMAFEVQGQTQAQEPQMDLGGFDAADMSDNLLNLDNFDTDAGGGLHLTTGPIEDSGNVGGEQAETSNIDADIDTLLNSAGSAGTDRMDMDYELGGIDLDNNNSFDDLDNNNSFDELFYVGAEDNAPESNDAYYGL